jgi:hypothetical protein
MPYINTLITVFLNLLNYKKNGLPILLRFSGVGQLKIRTGETDFSYLLSLKSELIK